MVPCPKCGWQNPDNAQKCANCFVVMRGGSAGQAPNQTPMGQQPQRPVGGPMQGQQPYGAPGGVQAPPGPAYPGQQRPAVQYFEYVGFWTRVGACIVDGVVLGILRAGIFAMLGLPLLASNNSEDPGKDLAASLVMLLIYAVYYTVMEGNWGASLGKMAAGIKVVRTDGNPIGCGTALGRYVLRTIFGLLTCGLAFIAVATNPCHQGWHDRIMNTMVVKSR